MEKFGAEESLVTHGLASRAFCLVQYVNFEIHSNLAFLASSNSE